MEPLNKIRLDVALSKADAITNKSGREIRQTGLTSEDIREKVRIMTRENEKSGSWKSEAREKGKTFAERMTNPRYGKYDWNLEGMRAKLRRFGHSSEYIDLAAEEFKRIRGTS